MFLLSTLVFYECLTGETDSARLFTLFKNSDIFGVELGLCNKGEFNINMSPETARVIRDNAKKNHITLRSLSTTCLNKASYEYDESNRHEALDIVRKMIDIASYLEIPTISFHGRRIPEKNTHRYGDFREAELDFLNKIADYGGQKNVISCLENRIDGFSKTAKDYIDLASQVHHENLKLCYDTGNGIFSSGPEEWINEANRKYVKLIHFSDVLIKTLRGVLLEFVKPGTGIIDFRYICELYRKADFSCDIVIEHFFRKPTRPEELTVLLNRFIDLQEV